MSTSVPPRDDDARSAPPPRSVLTSYDDLARFFHAAFPALIEQARSHLGDATGLAPRVVEGAVCRAWHEREGITSREELDTFIADDIRHRSARALSRRVAAHRLGHHGGEEESHAAPSASAATAPDAETSWQHVLSGIQGTSHTASAHAEAHLVMRHDAAEHVKAIAAPRSWKGPLLIGLAAVLLIAAGMAWMDRAGRDAAVVRAVNSQNGRDVATSAGQMAMITLDDGTRVRLAPDATLRIPEAFGKTIRAVRLDGAGSFEVAPGGKGDFRVVARDAVVIATGTRFTVYAYDLDEAATIVVHEGSVEVRAGDASRPVAATEAIVIPDRSELRVASAEEVEEATAWTEQRIAIVNKPLSRVLPQFRRMYDTDIKVQDAEILRRPVTLRASLDSLSAAIAAVEASAKVRFGYVGENMVFENAVPVVQAGGKQP